MIYIPNSQNPYDEDFVKSQLRVAEAGQKAWIDAEKKIYLDEELSRKREERRIRKEAEYEEIIISTEGNVELVIRNAIVPCERSVCNFHAPELVRLVSTKGDEGLFRLNVIINNSSKTILLSGAKMQSPGYVLNKLQLAGGEIHAKKRSVAEKITIYLISKLMATATEKVIPYQTGWNQYSDKTIIFVEEGEETWKSLEDGLKKGGFH